MHEILLACRTIWLRTDRPVVPTNTADCHHLPAVERALDQGVFAIRDVKRPEFYEIEVEDTWYYIHTSSCIAGVHLIAAGKKQRATPDARRDTSVLNRC